MLGALCNDELIIKADGPDEKEAIKTLQSLIEGNEKSNRIEVSDEY